MRARSRGKVVSCLRRLELLALEERNEKKLLQQQQRQQGNAGGAQAQPRGKGVGSGKGVSALGGEGARGSAGDSVGQRQLALVEVKLQVSARGAVGIGRGLGSG